MTDYQSAEAKIATLERQVALDQEAIRILQETSIAHAAQQSAAAQVLAARLQRYEYVLREIMAFAPRHVSDVRRRNSHLESRERCASARLSI